MFQTGKDHNAYLIDAANPGGVSTPAAQLNGVCAGESFGGSIYLPANVHDLRRVHRGPEGDHASVPAPESRH